MPTIFVHGVTGRQPGVNAIAEKVQLELIAQGFDRPFAKYFWGGSAMSLRWGGDSIPGMSEEERKNQLDGFDDSVSLPDLKQYLISSPLMELNAWRETEAFGGIDPEKVAMDTRREILEAARETLKEDLAARLEQTEALKAADDAFLTATIERCLEAAANVEATREMPDLLNPIMRSLTASLYAYLVPPAQAETSPVTWDALYRLVEEAVKDKLGKQQGGFFGDLLKNAALSMAMPMLRGSRGRYMPPVTRFLGDVFVYLSRRDAFLESMHAEVTNAIVDDKSKSPLWIIAHSMGGIIAYDYCVRYGMDVERLVTVGSQVGLFAEGDVLGSRYPDKKTESKADTRPDATLDAAKKLEVPKTLEQWINIYDLNDMLSFRCEPVFDKVQDKPVQGDAPFPESHGAYWLRKQTYELILSGWKAKP